jgi:hypothetical protein
VIPATRTRRLPNAARAAEERSNLVRWLRPEFQKTGAAQAGFGVEMEEEDVMPARAARLPWPPSLPERVRAVRDYLMQTPAQVAPDYGGAASLCNCSWSGGCSGAPSPVSCSVEAWILAVAIALVASARS